MKRSGISPAITTILLMAVAVVGAILATNSLQNQNQAVSQVTDVDVISANLYDLETSSKSYLAFTVQNTGTTSLSALSVSLIDGSSNLHSFAGPPLVPGAQWSTDSILDTDVVKGNQYALLIEATAADGSKHSSTFAVRAT